jgi:hypothetical protein
MADQNAGNVGNEIEQDRSPVKAARFAARLAALSRHCIKPRSLPGDSAAACLPSRLAPRI